MKSRYVTSGSQNLAFGKMACASFATTLIYAPWRVPPSFSSGPSGDLEHQHGDILSQPWLSLG